MDIIGKNAIPFDYAERRAKLVSAFTHLKDHVERWEAQLAKPKKIQRGNPTP